MALLRLLIFFGCSLSCTCAWTRYSLRPMARAHFRAQALARYVEGASSLDEDAAALLEEANGDVDQARRSYIGYTLAYLEGAMPELYETLKTDPKRSDAHRALVEVTWDAIAAFLPVTHDPVPTLEAQKRLTAVARAAIDGTSDPPTSVLDVGCGNGLLLPFTMAAGCSPAAYVGIDLSSRMIDIAQKAYSGAKYGGVTFAAKGFEEVVEEARAGDTEYDAIIFNGSIQFFPDLTETLAAAASILRKKPSSRLVLSHLSGGAFVQRERTDNPMTVLGVMPTLSELSTIAESLGLLVVTPSFMGSDPEQLERFLHEDLYLVILRWNAANGGSDGGYVDPAA